jgi:hypothetical protein
MNLFFEPGFYIRLRDINDLLKTTYTAKDIQKNVPDYARYSNHINIDSPCIACQDCNCNLEGWYGISL